MEGTWLDKFDFSTPSLTRASSANSVDEENQIEALAQETSVLAISDGVENRSDRDGDSKFLIQDSSAFIVDEPESYEQPKSQVCVFDEPESTLVLSPETDSFPLLGQQDGLDAEPQRVYSMSADGLVSSPMSAGFPTPDDGDDVGSRPKPRWEGRRKALLIGIKYYRNPRYRSLKGPHHDVREVQRLLEDVYGWGSECFRVLKDTNSSAGNQPTLENIKCELKQLVEDAKPGDHLFFYFSGHGGQVTDTDGDEDDGMDEVIVACDGKFLVDDELHEILVKPLPAGCHLTALLDCCSSGTSLDLPYNANSTRSSSKQRLPTMRKHSDGNVILLSACEDAERAYEKQDHEDEHKRVRGMLTKAFIDSLKTRRKSTYDELLTSVRSQLKRKGTMQNPQLSSSRIIDMNEYFNL